MKYHFSSISFILTLILSPLMTKSQEILLWPELQQITPSSKEKVRITPGGDHVISNIHHPSITPFLPDASKSHGTAVIIAPGGGHRELWIDHEGYRIAQWLMDKGIAAFVLKYRLAKDSASTYTIDGDEVGDLQQAIKLVRSRSMTWHIKPDHIGVMGFSAGGEVAGLASMRFSDTISMGMVSDKPDFQALIYPGGIQRLDVVKGSPPIFLLAGYEDRDDISIGLAQLYLKYKTQKIPAELHIYAKAGHGFGFRTETSGAVKSWLARFYDWLGDLGMSGNL